MIPNIWTFLSFSFFSFTFFFFNRSSWGKRYIWSISHTFLQLVSVAQRVSVLGKSLQTFLAWVQIPAVAIVFTKLVHLLNMSFFSFIIPLIKTADDYFLWKGKLENIIKDWKKFELRSPSVGFEPVQKSALPCLSNALDHSATEIDG